MSFVSPDLPGIKFSYEVSGLEPEQKLSPEQIKVLEAAITKIQKNENFSPSSEVKYILKAESSEKKSKTGTEALTTTDSSKKSVKKVLKQLSGSDDLEKVKNVSLSVIVKPSRLNLIFGEALKTEQTFHDAIKSLANAYRNDKTKFLAALAKHGIKLAEAEKLFSQFPVIEAKSQLFIDKLTEIKKLSDSGRHAEAMDKYAELINTEYKSYSQELGKFVEINQLMIERETKGQPITKALLSYFKSPPPDLAKQGIGFYSIQPIQRLPRHVLLYNDAFNEAGKKSSWASAVATLESNTKEVNTKEQHAKEAIEKEERFTKKMNSDQLTKQGTWMNELNKHRGWKKGDEKEFFKLLNDYGAAISPLREAYNKYKSDLSLANRIALRNIAKKQLPTINKLNLRLNKFNTLEKARILKNSLNSVQMPASVKKDVDFGSMLLERVEFVGDIYSDTKLNLTTNIVSNKFNRIARNNPDLWTEKLKQHKLTNEDIQKFNDFYSDLLEEQEKLLEVQHKWHGKETPGYKKEITSIYNNLRKIEGNFKKWGGINKLNRIQNLLGDMAIDLKDKSLEFPAGSKEEIIKLSQADEIDSVKFFEVLAQTSPPFVHVATTLGKTGNDRPFHYLSQLKIR